MSVPAAPLQGLPSLLLPRPGGLQLQLGQTLQAQVLRPGTPGQPGTLSLAGQHLSAQLPSGLQAGQRISLQVRALSPQQVTLQLLGTRPVPPLLTAGPQMMAVRQAQLLAGVLLLQRDPQLAQAALELIGTTQQQAREVSSDPPPTEPPPPLVPHLLAELPGGRTVQFDPGQPATGPASESGHSLRLVLHGQRLGALECGLQLDGGGLRISITADPTQQQPLQEAATSLQRELATQLGIPVSILVRTRTGAAPMRPQEVDLYG